MDLRRPELCLTAARVGQLRLLSGLIIKHKPAK
jgi:hypothetical protein